MVHATAEEAETRSGQPGSEEYWSVTVSLNGKEIVTIEPNCLAGCEIADAEERAIFNSASHLLSFIGRRWPE